MTIVSVCIVTCHRPLGLVRCLDSLAQLRFENQRDVNIQIVVIDNDAEGSARPVVDCATVDLAWPVVYEIEPQRGISFARNHAITASGTCDFIAFIDDDEVADPLWLDELLTSQEQSCAEIISGVVVPIFESSVPSWISQGKFFERTNRELSKPTSHPGTGNSLFRRDVLNWVAGPFDERFALSGGEDSLLFKQLRRQGARVAESSHAIVWEVVPTNRATVGWLMRRAYRAGNNTARSERAMDPHIRRSPIHVTGEALDNIFDGLKRLMLSPFRGKAAAVRGLMRICRGYGIAFGMLGHRYEQYRNTDGA